MKAVLLPAVLLAALAAPPVFGAVVEIGYRPAPGVPVAFSPAILQALQVQVPSLRPALGDPRGMAQLLLQKAHAPEAGAGGLASALILKRALTDPVAYAAVHKTLAAGAASAGSLASGLTEARESIRPLPEAREMFDRTFRPIEGALKEGGSLEDVGAALDRFFAGSTELPALAQADAVPTDGPLPGKERRSPAPLQPPARQPASLDAADFEPARLLEELKRDPFLRLEYAKGAGVSEGYSLERHTLMVMGQFERYFPGGLPGGTDRKLFRLILALHDIGKPRAIERGNKWLQHEATLEILRERLPRLGYSGSALRLASALVGGDPIGSYLQRKDVDRAAADLARMAGSSGVPRETFFELLLVFYMADASSYSRDAGGKPGLDYLFVFDRARGRLSFVPEVAARVQRLRDRFLGSGR